MGLKKYFTALLLPALMLLSNNAHAAPPNPTTSLSELPASSFSGEQFCFDAPISNLGDAGFGPYLRLKLPPEISFDMATFLGLPVISQDLGTLPPDIRDPLTDEIISGPDGYRLVTLKPPIGSVVDTGPDLKINICSTIDVSAEIGTPLDVSLQPVFQFGDSATGASGPISGTEITASITPSIVKFEKKLIASESENPPGPSWPMTYQLTADIANGKILSDLNFEDILPVEIQYVAGSISITGGTACVPTVSGQTVSAECSEATGTAIDNDVVVSFQAYIKDALDETQCTSQPVTNTARFNASNSGIALGEMNSTESVRAQDIVMQ